MNRRQRSFEIAEANLMEAQNVWLRGDQARAHPFYAGCLHKIGVCCLDQGKVEAAIKHLRDSIEVTKVHQVGRPAEHARSLFKLSEALMRDAMEESHIETHRLRDDAENILKKSKPEVIRCDTEEAFDNFIPIFWR